MYGDDASLALALVMCPLVLVFVITTIVAAQVISQVGSSLNSRRVVHSQRGRRRPSTDPLETICQGDPAFTWPAFCARALAVYDAVQHARMVRQPEMARDVMTAELLQGLENAADFRPAGGTTRSLGAVKVVGIGPVSTMIRGKRRVLTVQIVGETSAACRDAIMGGSGTSPDASGTTATVLIDELWDFERDVTARTAPLAATTGCPHCGAPVRDPLSPLCSYCGHALRQATDDWRAASVEPTPQGVMSA